MAMYGQHVVFEQAADVSPRKETLIRRQCRSSAIKEGIKTKVSSQKQVKPTMLNLQGNAEEGGSGGLSGAGSGGRLALSARASVRAVHA